jgi:WD40 repeat protein
VITFNGFISYSHAADGRLAPAVQRGLHRLAKPWHRRRALWIFRDQTGLAVTPALWSSIQKALDGSDWFVLLASPDAAQSPWVNREIEHWIATKSADRILPVVTDGEWEWDREYGDFTEDSTAVPGALRGVFAEEPLFLDLRWARGSEHLSLQHSRFRDAIAQLAAPMHGVSKDELEGEDVRQHRRARRLRSGAVATLVVLAVVASLTGVSAVRNAERANAAAAEARRQQQSADEQRGSAEHFADESRRQEELAEEQRARAADAAAEALRQEQLAREQQRLADEAAAEASRQESNARRQRGLADAAADRTAEQQRLAREATERSRRAAAETRRLAAVADEQRRLARTAAEEARRAAEEARRQQAKAEQQQRISVSRRLVNQARTAIGTDPGTALMLGTAALAIEPDAETRGALAGNVTSTHYAGALRDATQIAVARDGVVAARRTDGTVSLWNVAERSRPVPIATLRGFRAADHPLTFSPDGRTLAAVGADTLATLWNVADRSRPAPLGTLSDHPYVHAMSFSGDGRILAVGHGTGIAELWNVVEPAAPVRISTIDDWGNYPVDDIALSADGRTLVTNKTRWTTVYDVSDPAAPESIRVVTSFSTSSMGFSPTRPLWISGDYDGTVDVYHLDDLTEQINQLSGLSGQVGAVAFSPDGRILAAGDGAGTVRLWDMSEPASSRPLTSMRARGGIRSLAFGTDGRTLIGGDGSGNATVWNVDRRGAPRPLATMTGGSAAVRMAFRPDARSMFVVAADGTASLWNVADPARPQRSARLPIARGPVRTAAVSPDGRTVAAVGRDDGRLVVTDVSDPGRPATAPVPAQILPDAYGMVISPDGRTLAVAADETTLMLWRLAGRDRPTLLGTATGAVDTMAFGPDGRTLATADDRVVTLWNVTGRSAPTRLATLAGHSAAVTSVAFSPDGRTLASTGNDAAAILWDVTDRADPHQISTMLGDDRSMRSAGFSRDGRTLVTVNGDYGVLLWDVGHRAAPVRVATAVAGWGGARSAVFQPDGTTLAVSGSYRPDDANVTLWSYRDLARLRSDPARYACAATGRGLTAAEWARYIPELPYRRTCG